MSEAPEISSEIPPVEPLVAYQPEWSPWMRQFMTVVLVIAVVFGLVLLLPVLQILVSTFLLAFLMYVPARFIAINTRLRLRGALVVVYTLLIVSITLAIVVLLPNVLRLIQSVPTGLQTLQARAADFLRGIEPGSIVIPILEIDAETLLGPLRLLLTPEMIDPLNPPTTTAGDALAGINFGAIISVVTNLATGLLAAISGLISTGFLAVFLSLLILLDLPNYQNGLMGMIPRPYHREIHILFYRIGQVWRGFFRGQVTVGIIIGVLTMVQLSVMGIPQPVGLSVVVALISLIPTIGGFISLVPLGIVPLIFGSSVLTDMSNLGVALLVVGINVLWTQIIWNIVAPKIIGDAVSLPLPVIIVGIVIGAALGGVLGAFLIVPIAGSLRLIVLYILAKINSRDPFPGQSIPVLMPPDEL
ncbi:AI-2E family transporter [Aggregatilineales bacterium SYSU G02658]